MPTEAAPSAWAAISLNTHSGRLSPMMATLSPRAEAERDEPEREVAHVVVVLAPGERLPDPELLLAQRDAGPALARGVPHEELREGVVALSALDRARHQSSVSCAPRRGRPPGPRGCAATSSGGPSAILWPKFRTVIAVRDVHHDAHVVLDHHHRGPALLVDVEDEAGHVLLLLGVHAGHRLVEEEELRLERERARELDALLEAVGERADDLLADVLDLEEVDDLLDDLAVRDLLPLAAAAQRRRRASTPVRWWTWRPMRRLSSTVMPAEEGDVLEGARDAEARARRRRDAASRRWPSKRIVPRCGR